MTAAADGDRLGPGMRVNAVRSGGRPRRLAGVLLPPATPGGALRLHPDGTVDVVTMAAGWTWAHERPSADRKRDRRRQQCPAGRPIYRHDDLPAAQLATRTMLKRRRRRPADGQEPIASYLAYNDYSPLYAVADSVPLRALSPARQAAWTQARTCAQCGAAGERPWPRGVDRQRYCPDCREPAAAAWWYGQRTIARFTAAAWAAGVLADVQRDPDNVALVYVGYPTSVMSQTIVAETWDGEVLTAARVCDSDAFFREGTDTRPADLAAAVRQLAGRRLISWRGHQHWLDLLQETMQPHTGDLALSFTGGDAAAHWDQWQADRNPRLIEPYPFLREQDVRRQDPPDWDPPRLLAHVRHVVTEMASRPCYWWWATCQHDACGLAVPFGTSAARARFSDRHQADTGHVLSHTCTDGLAVPTSLGAEKDVEAGRG